MRRILDGLPTTTRPAAWWSLPGLLTLSRVPLAAALWARPHQPGYIVSVMLLAGLTDILDGWLGRRRVALARTEQERRLAVASSEVGAWLDPLVDKLFVVSLLALVFVFRKTSLEIVALVALREILMAPLMVAYMVARRRWPDFSMDFRAGRRGKVATVLQFVTVLAILHGVGPVGWLAVTTGIAGVAATVHYSLRAFDESEPAT